MWHDDKRGSVPSAAVRGVFNEYQGQTWGQNLLRIHPGASRAGVTTKSNLTQQYESNSAPHRKLFRGNERHARPGTKLASMAR